MYIAYYFIRNVIIENLICNNFIKKQYSLSDRRTNEPHLEGGLLMACATYMYTVELTGCATYDVVESSTFLVHFPGNRNPPTSAVNN